LGTGLGHGWLCRVRQDHDAVSPCSGIAAPEAAVPDVRVDEIRGDPVECARWRYTGITRAADSITVVTQ